MLYREVQCAGGAHVMAEWVCKEEAAMGNWVGVTIVATAVAVMTLGCNQQPSRGGDRG